MDILNYALQFEKEGEKFYKQEKERVKDKNIAQILQFLAQEERNHYRVIKQLKQDINERPATIFISSVKNIFSKMVENNEKFIVDNAEIIQVLEKALKIEDDSIKYYQEKSEVVTDVKAREILQILKKEEDIHYSLISSIIEYYEKPKLWLEQAEFSNLEDY